jgi:hypothetical protein
MKSFKDYNKEKESKKIPTLSWDSSFAEQRPKGKKRESVLSWDSAFADVRDKKPIKEAKEKFNLDTSYKSHESQGFNKVGCSYDENFHGHSQVKPQSLTKEHENAIRHYSEDSSGNDEHGHASSGNMNAWLRNKEGDGKQNIRGKHDPKNVEKSVKKLSSAFTRENTNRKPLTTYGGVPEHIGNKLENSGKGAEHHLAGFTSTSSSVRTAKHFARTYNGRDNSKVHHIVKYDVKPHAGLSIAGHSTYPENEVMLHHGAKVKYSHTTEHDDGEDGTIKVHHVTVSPRHKKLSEYGEYHDTSNFS